MILLHFNPSRFGGVETHTIELAIRLAGAGLPVTVCSLRRNELDDDAGRRLEDAGVEVVRPVRLGHKPGLLVVVLSAAKIRFRVKPSLIVFQGHGAAVLSLRLIYPRARFVWHEYWLGLPTHGDAYADYSVPPPRRLSVPMRIVLSLCDEVVVGATIAERNLRLVQGYRGPIAEIPPLTRPPALPEQTLGKKRESPHDGDVVLVMIARHGRGKGTLALLDMWDQIQEVCGPATLNLYGPAGDSRVLDRVRQCGPSVRWHGAFAVEQLGEILSEADGGIMASLQEGYGLVAVEYMAAGLPFLITNTGGADAFSEKNPNVVVCDTNISSLFAGIVELVSRIRSGACDAGMQRLRYEAAFSADRVAGEHLRWFRSRMQT